MTVRMIISSVLFIAGVFVYITSVIGLFKFKYVLNKMHCAALGDTLGILLIGIGAVVFYGFTFPSLKVLAAAALLWISGPVSSHMVALLEKRSNPGAEGTEYKEIDLDKTAKEDM